MEVQGKEKKISSELLYFLQYRATTRIGPAGPVHFQLLRMQNSLSLWLLCCCAIRLQHIQLTCSKSVSKWHLGLTVSGLVAGLVLERNSSNTRTPNTISQPIIGPSDCVRENDCGSK
jgi:hypothetical protein